MWIEFILLLFLIIYLFHRWATANNDFFLKRGIPHKKPKILFGNMWNLVLKRKSLVDIIVDLYNEHDGSVYGIFDSRQPVLLIRDPDIIKQITVKNFEHFINHRSIFGDENDKNNLFGSSLIMMKDRRWKDMRSTLSPAFTGSKMRQMFRLMSEVAVGAVAYLKCQVMEDPSTTLEVDVKNFVTRYSNDVIASTAFGLEINSFVNNTNEFYLIGKKVTTFTFLQNLRFLLYTYLKELMKILNVGLFDKKSTEYFMRLVIDAMKYRKENNITRPDMINMLMEARGMISSDNPKSHNREWSDVDIVAQCFLFFFAGFDGSASLTCCMAHEIMENAEVQEKLLQEIREIDSNLNGEPVTYEIIQSMRYMDNVISETLRKWTPAALMDRVCNEDITYELKDGKKLEIKKGDVIWIPTAGLHRDSAYYENPEKFDPERFSEANSNNINPFTYLPFGIGPRNCIASRFALLETKVLIYYLLRDFQFAAAKKSCVPLKLNQSGLQLLPKNGFWLKFVARNKNFKDKNNHYMHFTKFDVDEDEVYGFFDSRQPVLLIRDPDIIKQITVKDFNHFINHRALFNDENDKNNLFGSSLVSMRDSRWKDMRSTLSPAFTGSKMRQMFRLMNDVAVGAVTYLKQQQGADPTYAVEVDVTSFATRYSNDVIASTAFGLEINSFVDNDNEFYLMGKRVTTPTFFGNLRFMLYIYFNGLMKFLKIGPFDKRPTEYFMRLVIDSMKYRKENNITRPDMINMLMEARGMISSDNPKPHNREWSDVDIVAQCFVFFIAGFAATASVTCFMAHEIMENAEVQEKLLQEIRETDNNLNGEPVTYEVIQSMRYMDNVISETLRKWTPATIMDRVCNQDVTYELKDGKKLEIKKGDVIWIPTAGLHRDSAYYENPEKFDPERFNEANNKNINPFTYLPFGTGPRICIASRFALLETKVLIYYLLRDFQFAAAKNSCIPLKLAKSGFQVVPENGFWLQFIARN
ncbi:putative cytochrome P450 9f2 [Glossina fuscipes fuscipes]